MLNKNATSIIIIQGYVMGFWNGQTLMNCPTSGTLFVKWRDGILPDGVKVGKYVTITGKLITLDLGRGFLMTRAELLKPSSLKEIKKFVEERVCR